MKKILSLILAVFMIFSMSLCIGCKSSESQTSQSQTSQSKEYGELKLNQSVYYTIIQNEIKCNSFVYFATEAEKKSTEVFAISQDESIVTIKDGKICSGEKFGKTKVELYTDKKKAFLNVEIVSTLQFLRKKFNENADCLSDEWDFLACLWFRNNLNSFKNPKSVEVLDARAHWENSKVDFYMLKIRAENGLGGKTIGYYMLTSSGFSSGFSPYYSSGITMPNFFSCTTSYINNIVTEYKLGLINLF